MKNFTIIMIAFLAISLINNTNTNAQGCVAIRHFSTCSGNPNASMQTGKGVTILSTNYRYFKSFRHFRGTHEEPDRLANNSEVINKSHSLDINLNYGLSNKAYLTATLPFVYNDRSSLYEHGRTERHNSYSKGLGDARVGMGFWLKDVTSAHSGNVSLNLGLKLPTGNYNAMSTFYNVGENGSPEERPVDQSIQPGDGGWALTTGFLAFKQIGTRLSFYGSGFYMFNPKETNGTRTYRETLSPILQNEAIMAATDQYSIAAGFNYSFFKPSLSLGLGGRFEGIPVKDVIGGDQGFRRPGMVGSVEPSLMYMKDRVMLSVSVPIALYRNRPQSVTDLETEIATGNPRNGDAAFADYLINVGLSFNLTKRKNDLIDNQ
ncbi:transporter [Jiulongibacter sediminis]|uniref:Protein involved in meta-pathway of phenol degradation n=1 Tax=Jiulongibacter sediminis TaxID=1605367 RepID=A0A0P7BWF1_9BACT|nr:transporter [Jiulongibacter sediminis]KPM49288.1 protein involved in meta-pathway of phenol degradation [Jiulongibacter sediminis]TBX26341.1 protein involved in meta-pathway of phenol degradation [Jiulongibacter sediminis]